MSNAYLGEFTKIWQFEFEFIITVEKGGEIQDITDLIEVEKRVHNNFLKLYY